jgi:hypothetical protein
VNDGIAGFVIVARSDYRVESTDGAFQLLGPRLAREENAFAGTGPNLGGGLTDAFRALLDESGNFFKLDVLSGLYRLTAKAFVPREGT